MLRYMAIAIVVLCVLVAVIVVANTIKEGASQQTYLERERTEQTRLTEQTKQEAQQLRVEESSRVTNYLATMLGPLLGLGALALLYIVVDDRLTRKRMWEIENVQRLRFLEQQRLWEQRQLLNEQQYRYLLPDARHGVGTPRVMVYETSGISEEGESYER